MVFNLKSLLLSQLQCAVVSGTAFCGKSGLALRKLWSRLFLTDIFCYLVYKTSCKTKGVMEWAVSRNFINCLCYKSEWIVIKPQRNVCEPNGPLKCEKGNVLIS